MKILYVTTVSGTMIFFTSHIRMLLEEGHSVDLACNIGHPINQELLDLGCNVYNIDFNRSPLSKSNYFSYKCLKKLIIENGYDIVHTHTPIASVCARLACRKMEKVKVIYTAHGFHFFNGAPLQNWIVYFPIEKWLSRYTDVLITINKEDYMRANRSFKARNIEYMPGVGLEINRFSEVNINKYHKRSELEIPTDAFVILSIGELNKNKNHETVIKAIYKLKNPHIYYVICGIGPLEIYLSNLIKELGLEKQIKLLGFRKDIDEICKISDIFAFPSKREGLGMAALEAMATGLPILTSNIHGILDYSVNGVTGYNCNPEDIDKFAQNILYLKNNPEKCEQFGLNCKKSVEFYRLENSIKKLKDIYSNHL
ncbi:MAG: glycosyltransferase family 4 protein [Psychrobacillus psychrodurans]